MDDKSLLYDPQKQNVPLRGLMFIIATLRNNRNNKRKIEQEKDNNFILSSNKNSLYRLSDLAGLTYQNKITFGEMFPNVAPLPSSDNCVSRVLYLNRISTLWFLLLKALKIEDTDIKIRQTYSGLINKKHSDDTIVGDFINYQVENDTPNYKKYVDDIYSKINDVLNLQNLGKVITFNKAQEMHKRIIIISDNILDDTFGGFENRYIDRNSFGSMFLGQIQKQDKLVNIKSQRLLVYMSKNKKKRSKEALELSKLSYDYSNNSILFLASPSSTTSTTTSSSSSSSSSSPSSSSVSSSSSSSSSSSPSSPSPSLPPSPSTSPLSPSPQFAAPVAVPNNKICYIFGKTKKRMRKKNSI